MIYSVAYWNIASNQTASITVRMWFFRSDLRDMKLYAEPNSLFFHLFDVKVKHNKNWGVGN